MKKGQFDRERHLERLRRLVSMQQRGPESNGMIADHLSRIKMVITPWQRDEFGNLSRELYRADDKEEMKCQP